MKSKQKPEPFFGVADPLPEPKPKKREYLPDWAQPTPAVIGAARDKEHAAKLVSARIRKAANARLKRVKPTVPSTDANRAKIWARNKKATQRVMGRLWPTKTGADGHRLTTIFSGQWADVPLEEFLAFAADAGFEGVELSCWHIDIQRLLVDDEYRDWILALFDKYNLKLVAISAHLVGQAVLDPIDARHKPLLPTYVWGDGNPYGVNLRAALEMMDTVLAADRLHVNVVNGFTGSSIWHMVYDFPPAPKAMIQAGFDLLAARWHPILDVFAEYGKVFALEVHPTEIAYDIITFGRALQALDYRPEFGMNFDPSHLLWQGVDPVELIRRFPDRVYHVHMKDTIVTRGTHRSVLGSYLDFGDEDRGFDFVSLGRGHVDFNSIIRALNAAGYNGPLSNEWEDSGMKRTQGAREALRFIRNVDFSKSDRRMDKAFAQGA